MVKHVAAQPGDDAKVVLILVSVGHRARACRTVGTVKFVYDSF